MKAKMVIGFAILLLIVLINSCENKTTPLPTGTGCPDNSDTANLTYSSGTNTMKAIVDVQCQTNNSSCHSPGGASRFDYSTYAILDSNYKNGSLYQGLFGNQTRMPLVPQPGWDQCTLSKFGAWIKRGCPQ